MSSDLTFLTNEPGKSLLDRFQALLGSNTRFFDCLVGYFMISGFHKIYPALEETENIRILIGLKTDATVFQSLERAKEQQQLLLKSHAQVKEELPARSQVSGIPCCPRKPSVCRPERQQRNLHGSA